MPIPHAIAARTHHAKRVASGTQIRVGSATHRSGIHPVLVEPLQLVLKSVARRVGKIQSGELERNDIVLAATLDGSLVGVVRLSSEHEEVVLRGMQVVPELQRQGIGSALLEACLSRVVGVVCYCIPWAYLEEFYTSRGFERCKSTDAPGFLLKRLSTYLQSGRNVILMRRAPSD